MGKTDSAKSLDEAMITDLDFATNMVNFVDSLEVLVHALDTLFTLLI